MEHHHNNLRQQNRTNSLHHHTHSIRNRHNLHDDKIYAVVEIRDYSSDYDLQHFGSITSSAAAFKCIEHFGITKDLDQLIALIGCLDILVTSDQTNAFIAGSLGIPTLVIAPPNPHFALMAEGEGTPWFSSITLLRSCSWMGWDELIDPFAQHLQALVSQVVRE